ncbi:MAG: GNAT family N-acetyltransferase [Propionibacteriaceae bacterium]|jgi:predicted acetyltransferase|nr:GNAT family N-acetyltransferase [Propionibacteriaceae bacterium]
MREKWQLAKVGAERAEEVAVLEQWAWGDMSFAGRTERAKRLLDWERSWAAETQSGELIGFAASFHFDLPVPGAVLPTGGLTYVSVHPQHRRRGILRELLNKHFANSLQRGELASLLTASEIPIYTRFGYGQVDRVIEARLPKGVPLWDVSGQDEVEIVFERADNAASVALAEQVYQQAGRHMPRPGRIPAGQDGPWAEHFFDPPEQLESAETLRLAIAFRDGQPTGFATFRRKERWDDNGAAAGVIRVYQLVAADAATARALWGMLTNLDLMATIIVESIPADDPLFFLLRDPRQAVMRCGDFLHLRILDLPGALAARKYQASANLVIEVGDDLLQANAGRWLLQLADGRAEVSRTDADADLSLDIRVLASLYLGGFSAVSYGDAGLIQEHTAGSAETLARAMWTPRAPGTPFGF